MKSPPDYPVLRLTLLFFGAAEDVPEAAKMVTAGTARLHFFSQGSKPMAKCEPRPQKRFGDQIRTCLEQ